MWNLRGQKIIEDSKDWTYTKMPLSLWKPRTQEDTLDREPSIIMESPSLKDYRWDIELSKHDSKLDAFNCMVNCIEWWWIDSSNSKFQPLT